jgi:predicted phosphodiesterase
VSKQFKNILLFVLSFLALFSCQDVSLKNGKSTLEKEHFLFLGHTYHWYSNNKIDKRVQNLNLKTYDVLLLGGDLCSESSRSDTSLQHINAIFDVSNPDVLWAVGNHDLENGSLAKIEKLTGRKSFYAYYRNGITFLVLNTNIDKTEKSSAWKNKEYRNQRNLIHAVCDSIQKSSHLIVIGHNILWKDMDSREGKIVNLSKPSALSGDSSKPFVHEIYPLLKQVKKKGVEVVWLAGDIGKWTKSYSFRTDDGIQFLASGINNSMLALHPERYPNPHRDKLLLITHSIKNRSLKWEFVDLNFLYALQKTKEKGRPENKVDSLCLEIDSLYKNEDSIIANYSNKIKSFASWYKKVNRKAEERGFSVEEMLYRDARYLNKKNRDAKLRELYQIIPNPLYNQANSSTSSTKRLE